MSERRRGSRISAADRRILSESASIRRVTPGYVRRNAGRPASSARVQRWAAAFQSVTAGRIAASTWASGAPSPEAVAGALRAPVWGSPRPTRPVRAIAAARATPSAMAIPISSPVGMRPVICGAGAKERSGAGARPPLSIPGADRAQGAFGAGSSLPSSGGGSGASPS